MYKKKEKYKKLIDCNESALYIQLNKETAGFLGKVALNLINMGLCIKVLK